MGAIFLAAASIPAKAQLTRLQIDAVGLPANDAVLALRELFSANVSQVIEFAEEAIRQASPLCEEIMTEATRAAPDQIGELAAAILALAPGCEEQIATILAEGVAPAAGPETPSGPSPNPIVSPSDTAENPATDAASPTTL